MSGKGPEGLLYIAVQWGVQPQQVRAWRKDWKDFDTAVRRLALRLVKVANEREEAVYGYVLRRKLTPSEICNKSTLTKALVAVLEPKEAIRPGCGGGLNPLGRV